MRRHPSRRFFILGFLTVITDVLESRQWHGMNDSGDPDIDVLKRLRPQLREIFVSFGTPVEKAEAILKDVASILACRTPQMERPDLWVLMMVTSRCLRLREERQVEDPPQR